MVVITVHRLRPAQSIPHAQVMLTLIIRWITDGTRGTDKGDGVAFGTDKGDGVAFVLFYCSTN